MSLGGGLSDTQREALREYREGIEKRKAEGMSERQAEAQAEVEVASRRRPVRGFFASPAGRVLSIVIPILMILPFPLVIVLGLSGGIELSGLPVAVVGVALCFVFLIGVGIVYWRMNRFFGYPLLEYWAARRVEKKGGKD